MSEENEENAVKRKSEDRKKIEWNEREKRGIGSSRCFHD